MPLVDAIIEYEVALSMRAYERAHRTNGVSEVIPEPVLKVLEQTLRGTISIAVYAARILEGSPTPWLLKTLADEIVTLDIMACNKIGYDAAKLEALMNKAFAEAQEESLRHELPFYQRLLQHSSNGKTFADAVRLAFPRPEDFRQARQKILEANIAQFIVSAGTSQEALTRAQSLTVTEKELCNRTIDEIYGSKAA